MTASTPPSDASSLLVPINVNAWAVNAQNQELIAWYQANYKNLTQFGTVMDPPFSSPAVQPAYGIHLHWALPDALTHGRETSDGKGMEFPFVPNRWLVARFGIQNNAWGGKLWVVQSDYVGNQPVGTTSALQAGDISSLPLNAPGATVAIAAGTTLLLSGSVEYETQTVTTSADVAVGDTSIPLQPGSVLNFDLPNGGTLTIPGTSNFLDPSQIASMEVDSSTATTTFNVTTAGIGQHYTVDAWEASGDPGGELFLQAVAPGNVTFSAFVPQVQDVFSFVDTDIVNLPAGTNYRFTYLVVGWFSDPASADPMRGLTSYIPGVWKNETDWANQTVTQRFQALLRANGWSVDNPGIATPPGTSLYHGQIVDAQWPPADETAPPVSSGDVQVVVGNTAVDALAALVQFHAQSNANSDQPNKDAWLNAGSALAELLQAVQYDLLDEYGQPGGAASIDIQVHDAWFGSQPGGTVWTVVSKGVESAGKDPAAPVLTDAQQSALNAALAQLNTDQNNLDQMSRALQSAQTDLFMTWWKTAQANTITPPLNKAEWEKVKGYLNNTLYPGEIASTWQLTYNFQQAQSLLPNPTDTDAANQWANRNWTFPGDSGKTVTLADLGLKLKATTAPRFWNPSDPVVLISGLNRAQVFGEDGRFSSDNCLRCRLPGETITGLTITGQPDITVAALANAVNLNPTSAYTQVPSIANLAAEAFLTDPLNAAIMASAVNGDASSIQSAITALISQQTPNPVASWIGTAPTPFAITVWEQAWIPIFMEWSVNYFPTGSGKGANHQFSMADWAFDGTDFAWKGTGFNKDYFITYTDRTFLTPHAAKVFKSKLQKFLKGKAVDTPQVDALLAAISDWDVLSQSLSGFTGQLITQFNQETFVPPGTVPVPFIAPNPADGGLAPSLAALVGEEYHAVPMMEGTAQNANFFNPIRAGFLQFDKLQVVDAFGQVYQFQFVQGFEPLPAEGLAPTNPPTGFPDGLLQLPPRFVQSARLDFDWLANDGSGQTTTLSSNPNAVCGWLLPNHLDGGLAVYDQNGILLGELLPPPASVSWRPRPGPAGSNPPPSSPGEIVNVVLRNVVESIANRMDSFGDFLQVIDETLWMIDPLGGRKDQMLSAFIGRPLAVVQAQVSFELNGDPDFNQFWNSILDPKTGEPVTDIGEVPSVQVPVALGNLQLNNDGLIGYFLPGTQEGNTPYSTFYSVHTPEELISGDSYIQQIVDTSSGAAVYQGNVFVQYKAAPVVMTLLLDPRGSVHASTGVLPTIELSLPPSLIETFIQQLNVTFSTGPLLADPGTLSVPKPAENHGTWTWIQAAAAPGEWVVLPISNATDQARLPDQPPVIQEGWLGLSGLGSSASN